MKKSWKQRTVWLTAAALLLAGCISLPKAMAYFTTYAAAGGGVEINISSTKTEVEEKVEGLTKQIQLRNTSTVEEYVRVKVLCGAAFTLEFSNDSGNWSLGDDGYWYYGPILKAGETTDALLAAITVPEGYEDDFDVIVIEESTPVLYDENGNPYADWSLRSDNGTAEEGDE